jgi:hypothetical protein
VDSCRQLDGWLTVSSGCYGTILTNIHSQFGSAAHAAAAQAAAAHAALLVACCRCCLKKLAVRLASLLLHCR